MKVVLVQSYSTNKTSATTRPAVFHNGQYYAIGDYNSPGATKMIRLGIAHKINAKHYTFIHKDSYVQPGFTVPASKARIVRVLGDLPRSLGNILDTKIERYKSLDLPVRELG